MSLIIEVEQEKQEFELYKVREGIYWNVNIQMPAGKHIERNQIFNLPSEKAKVDLVQEYNKGYAERMLKRMRETTQTTQE